MEIKKGQWVRLVAHNFKSIIKITNKEIFQKVVDVFKNGNMRVYNPKTKVTTTISQKYVISVANDPRELIQVGDCIRYNIIIGTNQVETKSLLCEIDCVTETCVVSGGHKIPKQYTIEIWTKTDDDTYKCQWRAE